MYILGCSVKTYDEPVCANLALETLRYRKDVCKWKWDRKVKRMNDQKHPFKVLSDEWNKVKSKGCHWKCWFAHVHALKKELSLLNKVLKLKLIKEALDKKESEEFEKALQHKSKLRVFKEMKCGVGFKEY